MMTANPVSFLNFTYLTRDAEHQTTGGSSYIYGAATLLLSPTASSELFCTSISSTLSHNFIPLRYPLSTNTPMYTDSAPFSATESAPNSNLKITIDQPCTCTCLHISSYSALSFNTDAITGCLHCDKTGSINRQTENLLRILRRKRTKNVLISTAAGIGTTGLFLATAGISEIVTGGLGTSTTMYKGVRVMHLAGVIRHLKSFQERVIKGTLPVRGCQCAEEGGRNGISGICNLNIIFR